MMAEYSDDLKQTKMKKSPENMMKTAFHSDIDQILIVYLLKEHGG